MKKISMIVLIVVLSLTAALPTLAATSAVENEFTVTGMYLMDIAFSYKEIIGQKDYCYKLSDVYYYGYLDGDGINVVEKNIFKKHNHNPNSSYYCIDCGIYVSSDMR